MMKAGIISPLISNFMTIDFMDSKKRNAQFIIWLGGLSDTFASQ